MNDETVSQVPERGEDLPAIPDLPPGGPGEPGEPEGPGEPGEPGEGEGEGEGEAEGEGEPEPEGEAEPEPEREPEPEPEPEVSDIIEIDANPPAPEDEVPGEDWLIAGRLPGRYATTGSIGGAGIGAAGGLVVKLADNNNAPRQKITIDRPEPASYQGDIELTVNNDKVQIWNSEQGGFFLPLPAKFPAADLPIDLWVQGVNESVTMRDVTISISADGSVLGSVLFTVLWVDKPDVRWSGPVSAANNKKSTYQDATITHNLDLKFQEFEPPGGPGQPYPGRWGFGTEAGANVSPGSFSYPGAALRLDRDAEFNYFVGDEASTARRFKATIPPGNDTSLDVWRDDDPPRLFDLDAPGISNEAWGFGTIIRTRMRFKAFASVHAQGKDVRCSEITRYFVVLSMKQTTSPWGWTWIQVNDVAGDNKIGSGSTKLSWNLQ